VNFLKNFEPLIEYGPHWINFIILTFIIEKNKYSKSLYKIWNKIISFDMKKKGNFKIGHRKSEEKDELESLTTKSICFKGCTPIMLGPMCIEFHVLYLHARI
jgi:hypothetical protein